MIASKQYDFKSFAENSMLSEVIEKHKLHVEKEINDMEEH